MENDKVSAQEDLGYIQKSTNPKNIYPIREYQRHRGHKISKESAVSLTELDKLKAERVRLECVKGMLRGEIWRVNGEVARELLGNGCWRAA